MSTQAEHGARTGERVTISFEEPGPRDTARVGRRLRAAKAAANQIEQAEGPLQLPPGIKACPACGMLIEKIGGDDNVMCGCEAKAAGGTYQKALRGGGCGHEFNFKTLASVGTGRLGHPANAKQKLFFLDQEDDDEDLVAGAPLRPPPPRPQNIRRQCHKCKSWDGFKDPGDRFCGKCGASAGLEADQLHQLWN